MQRLILIKHAQPKVDPLISSREWVLSDEGQTRAQDLAERLRPLEPQLIFTSSEPKASQTAQILADRLAAPTQTIDGLEEHDRTNVPHLPSRDFISFMALFFQRPRQLVLGEETADRAKKRVVKAILEAVEKAAGKTLAIVTHGTVLALFAADYLETDPFQLWRKMGQPSYLILELPEWKTGEFVERL
jgi:broad specificity phosphatase PhoE